MHSYMCTWMWLYAPVHKHVSMSMHKHEYTWRHIVYLWKCPYMCRV
jgi:hypothetical protein